MQRGEPLRPSSKSKQRVLGNRILPVFPSILLPLRSQMWPSKYRTAAVVSLGCQCCTYSCMHYNALMWLCVTCVFYELRSFAMPLMLLLGFKYVVPVWFFVFYSVWKCIFLCTLTSLWAHDHANVSLGLFSAFIFVSPLRFNFLTRLQRGDICHFVRWFGAGLPCGEGDTEILWVDNYLRVLFKDLCPSDMVWAAEASHSCPTSTSQCRCSSPARVQQGAGHQPQSRPVALISVRHAHHTRAASHRQ